MPKVPYATRRDGWEVARTTTKGDVVFIDPTYLGVQAYGGSKDNVTSRDANDVKEAIKKLVDLAKTAIEKGFSIVYTNEFSDKSKAKKGGLSQEQYADIWNEAMRQIWQEVGQENASIAYVDRGKKDAADVVIAIGKARDVLEQAIKNVRRDEKTRTQNANRATPSDTTTIANPNAEVNNEVDPQATSARQKDAHGVYPDASGDIARASIGGRRQAEYRGIIAKHRPNLQQAHCQPHNAYTGAQTNLFPYHETSYVCDYVTYNTRSRMPLAIERAVCYIIRGKRSRKDFICGTNTWTGSWHNSPSRG